MAGQIAELSRRSLKNNFRNIDPASARVLLLDGGDAVLANFGRKLSAKGTAEIERAGVEVQLHSRVTDVKPDAIIVQGPGGEERIACHTRVSAAGVQASPLAAMLAKDTGAGTDRAGHIEVLADCTLPGHPEVFAVGDMMSLKGLPGVAEVAMQSGIHAARTIKRRVQEGNPSAGGDLRLPRPRQHGDDLALPGDRELQGPEGRRFHRLADVGVRAPDLPDGLQEPLDRPLQVAVRVRRELAGRAHDHDAAGHGESDRRAGGDEAGQGRPLVGRRGAGRP